MLWFKKKEEKKGLAMAPMTISDWISLEERLTSLIYRWLANEISLTKKGSQHETALKELLGVSSFSLLSDTPTGDVTRRTIKLFGEDTVKYDNYLLVRLVDLDVLIRTTYPKEFIDAKIQQLVDSIDTTCADVNRISARRVLVKNPFLWLIPSIQYVNRFNAGGPPTFGLKGSVVTTPMSSSIN